MAVSAVPGSIWHNFIQVGLIFWQWGDDGLLSADGECIGVLILFGLEMGCGLMDDKLK